jgi:hypothetical protein
MRCALVLASVLLLGASVRAGAPDIAASGGSVTIHAENLPLSQILDRLSTLTGMALTYEGTRPAMPITMTADGISEVEAIQKLMEGLGVSYVLSTDPTGLRVTTLIVAGTGGGGGGARVASSQAPAPEPEYEPPVGDYGTIPLDPAVLEAAGPQTRPDLNNPYLGLPPQHFPQALQPQPVDDPTGSSGSRNMPGQPMFPQGASYPR